MLINFYHNVVSKKPEKVATSGKNEQSPEGLDQERMQLVSLNEHKLILIK